ncbi:MAG: CRTAC1 family protein [Bryobacteraceae bacterium]|nr:CRTAC1 family protein [Bryobacteraceae bacterium]
MKRRAFLGLLAGGRCFGEDLFRDVTKAAGLGEALNVFGEPRNKKYLIEEMGGGVALIDYDNDGWVDLFLVNGARLGGGEQPRSFLFRNNRDGTFTDVTQKTGLRATGWGQGCCVGDYNNDGWDDLFVSYYGKNVLYRNNGDGTFTDVSQAAGVGGYEGRWGAGCCFLDYDRDGHLDLFVANYVTFDLAKTPLPGESPLCRFHETPVPCGPQGMAGGTNVLYRNRGDGTFEDVSAKTGIANPRGASTFVFSDRNWRPSGSYGMGAAAADFDNDGWTDIYVAGDSAPSLLYHNNGDGTFREVAVEAGAAFDENGVAMSGMGVGVGDYNGDGWFDIARTNFSGQVTTIYRNNGDGTFHDASLSAGMGVNRKYLGFGVAFFDYDNDGWKDLFVANGHVYAQLADRGMHVSYAQPGVLYANRRNGKFGDVTKETGTALAVNRVSRGCAIGDLNNDGRLEIVLNNLDAAPTVLRREQGAAGNSLLLKLRGVKSNRSGIGARVRVRCGDRTQVDEVMSGTSYYSSSDLRLHFGLGAAAAAVVVEVDWPSGMKDRLTGVAAGRVYWIEEGKGAVRSEALRPQ